MRTRWFSHASRNRLKEDLRYPINIEQGIGLRVEGRALILRDFFMGCSWVKRPGGRG
ncbi:MAG TPA: hypothetical protein VN883_10525 [Myxococcales bacterium]|nr:hypothetical protein [Myxococcales bacterium]